MNKKIKKKYGLHYLVLIILLFVLGIIDFTFKNYKVSCDRIEVSIIQIYNRGLYNVYAV